MGISGEMTVQSMVSSCYKDILYFYWSCQVSTFLFTGTYIMKNLYNLCAVDLFICFCTAAISDYILYTKSYL